MNVDLADVTIHLDQAADEAGRKRLDDALRANEGVVSVHFQAGKEHLMVVEYNPAKTASDDLLSAVQAQGFSAELIGL